MRMMATQRTRPEDLGAIRMRTSSGDTVPMSLVVTRKETAVLQTINRLDRERAISITGNVAPGHSQQEAMTHVAELAKALPMGYRVVASGQASQLAETTGGLFFALGIGILVAYMVLASQFNSFLHPITVLTILPLALSGAALGLWLSGKSLNIFSMIGVLLLMGIVKKNSILLVEYANQVRETDLCDARTAMHKAGPMRLRPILMTTVATMMSAVPAILGLGPGTETRSPMAAVVLGGLTVSTVLSLLVVPAFYLVADRIRTRILGPEVHAPHDPKPDHPAPPPHPAELSRRGTGGLACRTCASSPDWRRGRKRDIPHLGLSKLARNPTVWIVLAVILAIGVTIGVRSRGPKVPVVAVARKDLEQHIVASGRVMPPARVNVAALTAGLVVAVGAVEGQHVRKGELLVQVDDAEARAQVAQAKAQVAQASAKVEQLKKVGAIVASQSLSQAQSRLDSAAADLQRAEGLGDAIPRIQLEDAKRAVDVARAQRTAAEATQLGTLGADSRVAMSTFLQAQAQLMSADVRLAQTRIVASHDGVVLSRAVEVGDVVQLGRTLLVVASDGDVELVFQSDERNLATLALSQKAKAAADAFPQDVFDAEVDYLAPSIDPQRGTVEVHLRVPKPPAFLRPDMTVSVDLLVAARKNALVLPSETVRGLATPAPWVLAVENGVTVRREVKLGIRGEGDVEIAGGVAEGAAAVVPDGQILTPGQRVRVTQER
jgi:HlyD family secretion protein